MTRILRILVILSFAITSILLLTLKPARAAGPWHVAAGNSVYLPFIIRSCLPQYTDDFSNPASGWPVGDDGDFLLDYDSGEYRILVRPAQGGAGAYPWLPGLGLLRFCQLAESKWG